MLGRTGLHVELNVRIGTACLVDIDFEGGTIIISQWNCPSDKRAWFHPTL